MRKTFTLLTGALIGLSGLAATAQEQPVKVRKGAKAVETSLRSKVPAQPRRAEWPKTRRVGSNPLLDMTLSRPRLKTPAVPTLARKATHVNGCVVYSSEWSDMSQVGIYALNLTGEPMLSDVTLNEYLNANGGATLAGDKYVATHYAVGDDGRVSVETYIFDATDWSLLDVKYNSEIQYIATDMTYDAVSETIYGCFLASDGINYEFGTFNPETNRRERICLLAGDNAFWNITADTDGNLYALDKRGNFGSVDKATGVFTPISETGISSYGYMSSMAYDPGSGLIYVCNLPNTSDSYLYSIDPVNGEHTLICQIPGNAEMTGLFFALPEAADLAPDAPVIGSIDFVGSSLSGSVTFTAPSLLYNGDAADMSSALNYTVTANGEQLASGPAEWGKTATASVTVPKAGMYEFTVRVSNSEGVSPAARTTVWVGNDTPSGVTGVTLSYSEGALCLTWNPVKSTIHDGYIDPAAVTYNITRMTDGQVVATGVSGTSWSEPLAMPETLTMYKYKVTALYDGVESEAGISNAVTLGNVVPPFTCGFDDEDWFDMWTAIDRNGNDRTWRFSPDMGGCVYSPFDSNMSMDSWLISPAIRLEAGKTYEVSIDVACSMSVFPERIEAFYGTGTNPDDFNLRLLEPTVVDNEDFKTLTGNVMVEASGIYRIAYHGISDADQYNLYADNFRISAGLEGSAPSAVTGFEVTPDSDGMLQATVSLKAPTRTIGGAALESIDRVEVYCNDELAQTFSSPAPGKSLKYVQKVSKRGVYNFTAVAYNADGKGITAQTSAYIGVNVPGPVSNVRAEETSEGIVHLTWDAATTDVDGRPMNPGLITYVIMAPGSNGYPVFIADGIEETEFTFRACNPGDDQILTYYYVYTESTTGMNEAEPRTSNVVAVGAPFELPYVQGFPNGVLGYPMGTQNITGAAQWIISRDDGIDGIKAVDGDNGYLYMAGTYEDDSQMLFTGKVAVTGSNPSISYYVYGIDDDDENTLELRARTSDGVSHSLETTRVAGHDGWRLVSVSLADYVGQNLQFEFIGVIKTYPYILLDHIYIGTPVDYNLAISDISAPAKVEAGADFNVTAKLTNQGLKDAEGYAVDVYRDGKLAASLTDLSAIAPAASQTVTFTDNLSVLAGGEHKYRMVINYAKDEIGDDDSTADATITVTVPALPVVSIDGTYDEQAQTVTLSWDAVSPDNALMPITEDFEDPEVLSFDYDTYKDWTFHNYNSADTYGLRGITFYNETLPFGFILFDGTGIDAIYNGYESPRYMCAIAHEKGANDAWMISPLLPGKAQTISFMAKCWSEQYGAETFEVLYSTTDTEPESFKQLTVTGDGYDPAYGATEIWTKYSVDLPEGAKYFAIHSTANDCFALQIDDVSFMGYASMGGSLNVLGYNVYRDGVKLNDTPLTTTSYTDTGVADKDHSYVVTVVYDKGESGPSNVYSPSGVGISTVEATASADVYTLDGIKVRSAGEPLQDLQPGIYVIGGRKVAITHYPCR